MKYNPTQADLDRWVNAVLGGNVFIPPANPEPSYKPESAPAWMIDAPASAAPAINTRLIEKLRSLADGMQKTIDEKINHQFSGNWTHKRARESEGIRRDGYRLEKVQAGLRALADAHEAGTVPLALAKINSKKAVEELLDRSDCDLLSLMDGKVPDRAEEERRRQLEQKARELVGQVPGYFPTPKPVVDKILNILNIQEGDDFLEPEAGSGNIAVPARERGANVDVIERNYTLSDILKVKGFEPIGYDFLEMSPNGKRYNKIGMNPPFEGGADIDHARHAYDFLADGGIMVSVISEGAFYRNDRKATGFREWLSEVGGADIDLPAGAFQESGTGVKTRLVVIEK